MLQENLVLDGLQGGNFTANELIGNLYKSDIKQGLVRTDWKFYNHINKRFAPLERKGMIKVVGYKTGPTGRTEKVWSLCDSSIENMEVANDLAA